MQKHPTSRICNVANIPADMLKIRLTPEQRARIPSGKAVKFRKSTYRSKSGDFRYVNARAEYDVYLPEIRRTRPKAVATRLIGIIWDDDPEWLYETDKSRSPIKERRIPATPKQYQPSRDIAVQVSSLFAECLEYEDPDEVVIVRKLPIPIFMTVAVCCSMRGITDATAVANYWNQNLDYLRKLFPAEDLQEVSHDTVNRVYMSLTEKSVKNMLRSIYDWVLPKVSASKSALGPHIALDGQACRASRNHETGRRMMLMNAVNVTFGRLCVTHTMISTKSQEPKYVPDIISEINVQGAMVSMDALNTTAEIAHAIVNAGGLYLLAVKNNQPKLNRAVRKAIAEAMKKEICPKKVEDDHWRVEKRSYVVAPANTLPASLLKKWPGLEKGCVIRAETQGIRQKKNGEWQEAKETRWFITCYPYPFVDEQATSEEKAKAEATIEWLGACVRNHWGVETTHWIIDWTWRQDQMECQYPGYLRARETLAKIGHNLLVLLQQIDHRERGKKNPRSEHELSKLVGVTVEDGLRWLQKIQDFDLAIE